MDSGRFIISQAQASSYFLSPKDSLHSVLLPYQTVDFTIIILSKIVMTKFSKIDEKLFQIKSIYDHDNSINASKMVH